MKKIKILALSRCLCLKEGDGDEGEDAGEAGGEWRERILFFLFLFFVFLFFP